MHASHGAPCFSTALSFVFWFPSMMKQLVVRSSDSSFSSLFLLALFEKSYAVVSTVLIFCEFEIIVCSPNNRLVLVVCYTFSTSLLRSVTRQKAEQDLRLREFQLVAKIWFQLPNDVAAIWRTHGCSLMLEYSAGWFPIAWLSWSGNLCVPSKLRTNKYAYNYTLRGVCAFFVSMPAVNGYAYSYIILSETLVKISIYSFTIFLYYYLINFITVCVFVF